MKKRYPNLKEDLGLLIMFIAMLVPSTILVFFTCENETFWLLLGLLIVLWLINIFFFITSATLNICIEETFLLYQGTCFSKVQKILLQDIKRIILNYHGRSPSLDIIHRSGKIFFALDISVVKELMCVYPKNLFEVQFIYRFGVPKRHKGFLLSMGVLDKKQRKRLSDD